ncbi:MAG: hypothetical protein BRC25_01660 [Parcubacteria group bacterium SW_6_46_9]|nr:MAG: hypothetical protein BRC25_01660 [Parcubacteria group bacterium SW_6_46_9]
MEKRTGCWLVSVFGPSTGYEPQWVNNFWGAFGRKKFIELASRPVFADIWLPLLVGCIAAFVSGLIAMHVLMRFVQNHRLDWFAWYRVVLAIAVLILL